MELRHIINIIWKWLWLILLAVAIAAISSYLASKATTPLYRTKSTMMIGRVTQSLDPNNMQIWTSQQLVFTYIQLAKREPVLKGAIESLGLDMSWQSLAGRVSANAVPQTQLLEVTVIDSDPYRAKVLADAVVRQLILLSPGTANQNTEQASFTQSQLDDLKIKINDGQQEVIQLKQELDAANSARQIQDLQTQIGLLENKISSWQHTYSQLLISYQGSDVNALSLLEEAQIPTQPFSPNVMNNVLVASVIGLVLALGGAFLIEYLDDTVKSVSDVTHATGLTHLGSLPFIEGNEYSEKLIAANQPLSPVVEAFRVLRTNLQFSSLDRRLCTLMMTSPNPSEGKSVAISNLGVVLAQSGRKVVVIDTDLRRPTLHKIFDLPNRTGLTNALVEMISPNADAIRNSKSYQSALNQTRINSNEIGHEAAQIAGLFKGYESDDPTTEMANPTVGVQQSTLQSRRTSSTYSEFSLDLSNYLQETGIPNLMLLSTGQIPPNPTEMIGSELMGMLIHTLRAQVDMILFDSPPTLVFADAAVLSTRVDGVILITDMGRTRTNEASRAADELRRVHANLIGVILNRAGNRQGNYYYYYYHREDGKRRQASRWSMSGIIGRFRTEQTKKKQHPAENVVSTTVDDN